MSEPAQHDQHASELEDTEMVSRAVDTCWVSPFEDITYSRQETVAAVTDFYQFLTKMYMKESQVVYPPEGGWPSIVNCYRDRLGKSDEAVGLLTHPPYIKDRRCQRHSRLFPYGLVRRD
ncbi:hypothetical protein GE09DRAFT_765441 [Coniochaeta sp. 2T2.1]|nr:hypothetical protein GE09DRAFT_765441 [Coniochaeta sp. 2T2.1]